MNSNPIDLKTALDLAEKLFYLEMDQTPTAFLYGSAATGDWSPARSDLDLVILINDFQLPQFKEQLVAWKKFNLPPLDGFVCAENVPNLFALRLEALLDDKPDSAEAFSKRILPPDRWKIQNRSKRLFGTSNSLSQLPDVTQSDLKKWALSERDNFWIPFIRDALQKQIPRDPDTLLPLKNSIWIASTIARTAHMAMSGECISKQEALKYFIQRLPKSEPHINFLLENFDQDEGQIKDLSARQADEISVLCYELLIQP